MSSRPRTKAGTPVTASRCWTLGRIRCVRGRRRGAGPCAVRARPEEVGAFDLVELERSRERVEDAIGDTGGIAALEPRVVVDADPGEERDLFATEAGDATQPGAEGAQTRLLRRDPGRPGSQELAQLALRVHGHERSSGSPSARGPVDTWNDKVGHRPPRLAFLALERKEPPNARDCHVRGRRRPSRGCPRPADRAADGRDSGGRPRLHLRQRPVAVQLDGAERERAEHGPRGDRRRRGRRQRGAHRQTRRPGGDAVRDLRRQLRVLPGGAQHGLRACRVFRQRRACAFFCVSVGG
jgi:hypothetical protein